MAVGPFAFCDCARASPSGYSHRDHSSTNTLRSSLPRSVLGSDVLTTICFGALKAGSPSLQKRSRSLVSIFVPGRATT